MARDGDRRGAGARRRSPQELAETLAELAASTPEPPARPRRGGRIAEEPTPETSWPGPDETLDVTALPEPDVAVTALDEATPAPVPELDAPAREYEPPAPEYQPPAPDDDGPPAESDAPDPPEREAEPRISKRRTAGPRLHSRAGGRVWQRGSHSRSRRGLRTGRWRRSRAPRSPSERAKRGPRNLRRLYPPLLVVLLIVVVVALLNQGGGSSNNTSAQSASTPRSVFPAPSTVPAPTPPPVPAPTPTVVAPPPTVKQQPSATQHKACRPVQVGGRPVSVSILRGQVNCRNARAVVLAFKSGKGRHRGPPGNRYVRVRGWRCLPSGTCTRAGKSIKAA